MNPESAMTTARMHGCRATIFLAASIGIGAPATRAQQVLQIDTAAGRIIIDDEWRSVETLQGLVVDRTRAIIYANDAEEPEGVMAFSLETGEWLRTIRTPTGDGPFELSRGKTGMALAGHGGLYVSGYVRVLEFDSLGTPVSNWSPRAEVPSRVCDLDGQPAIPARAGVVRRGSDGEDEVIGPREREEAAEAAREGGFSARIVCGKDKAYVVVSNTEGPDSVFAYHRNGDMARLAVPDEVAEGLEGCTVATTVGPGIPVELPCINMTRQLQPSLDSRGHLALLGHNAVIPGAIIDPETGCYAVVRKQAPSFAYDALRVYQDSALVFWYDRGTTVEGNKTTFTTYSAANRISLHPLRRVSGEPCPGMLPSVDDSG